MNPNVLLSALKRDRDARQFYRLTIRFLIRFCSAAHPKSESSNLTEEQIHITMGKMKERKVS
jgi:hypothetical protein